MVICLELGADLHMTQLMPLPLTVSCFSKIQIGFTVLVPSHPRSLGKRAVKHVCVMFVSCHRAVYGARGSYSRPSREGPTQVCRSARCLRQRRLQLSISAQHHHRRQHSWSVFDQCSLGLNICSIVTMILLTALLARGAGLHMAQLKPLPLIVSCCSKIQIGLLNVFVCVCVRAFQCCDS